MKKKIFNVLVVVVVILGVIACSDDTSDTTSPTPKSVNSVTLQTNGVDVGAGITREKGDADITFTAKVEVSGGAGKTLTWESSDIGVAIVTNGVVSIVGKGVTVITATSTVDPTKKDSVEVTVKGVKSVTLHINGVDVGAVITKKKGEDITFTATVVAFGGVASTVTWVSTNTAVATVTDGVVSILQEGVTEITATSTADPTKKDSVELTVGGVKSVTLQNKGTDAGDKLTKDIRSADITLTADVVVFGAAGKTVKWTSSDTGAATVTNGVVRITGEGVALITATSTADTSVKDSIEITVKGVKSVTLQSNGADAGDTLTKKRGDADITLTANVVAFGGVATTVTWASSDTGVATVTGGVVKIVDAGTAVITATSTVDATKKDSIALTVDEVAPTAPTGLTLRVQSSREIVVSFVAGEGAKSHVLRYGVSGTFWVDGGTITSPYTLKNLTPNTRYSVQVKSVNSKGEAWGSEADDTTSQEVTSVTLQRNGGDAGATLTKNRGDADITLTARVAAEGNSSTTVTWKSSDTGVATVSGGVVKIVAPGNTVITATSTGDTSKKDSITVIVNEVAPGAPTGETLTVRSSSELTVTFVAGKYATSYNIKYRQTQSQFQTWSTKENITSSPYILQNLSFGQEYEVQVVSVNSAGKTAGQKARARTQN